MVVAAMLLLLHAISNLRHEAGKIGSEDYQRIITGKDLVADILPPTSFISETYLVIVQAAREPWNRDAHFAAYRAGKDAYFRQLEYWKSADIPEHIRTMITIDSPTVLDRFWIEAENNFFPNLANSGGIGLGAAEINKSLETLTTRFREHKQIAEAAAAEAKTYLQSVEMNAASHMNTLGWVYVAISVSSLLLIFGLLWTVSRKVVRPMVTIAGYTQDLADGHATDEVPYVRRRDELGSIARALTVFKETAAKKLEAERQAREERDRTAQAKAVADAELAAKAEETERAITRLATALNHLAEGDLDCGIDEPFEGELERLRNDFNVAIRRIGRVFSRITMTSASIETGSQEIFRASDDLSRRTEQQAASLEETASTLEEITATVQKSSESAQETRNIVAEAKRDAETSGDIVKRALGAMTDIENSAEEINQIIAVIDEIAFQTNLLALNAGVEAARAGDAGLGFAVVASEVRALAQRSATAAKEIKELISKSSEQVSSGSELVSATGETLHRIAGQVVEISDVVDLIADGATNQFAALKQLNASVGEMDAVTQQNAAMAEEASAASHALSEDAQSLADLLGRFRLAEAGFREQVANDDLTRRQRPPARHQRSNEAPRQGRGAFRTRAAGNAALAGEWEDF
ncbi:methyl-accepting chemotaxis protein [Oricola cellulosilytica]|uniref:methyl-accepting chemotaxis protein n=1 Tax=Oricola cellulosilytica TaxID=1429082 RepID=UPI001CBDD720|nr:methyl-accepting chemotaxis protein [Oricola cellulosilytica]